MTQRILILALFVILASSVPTEDLVDPKTFIDLGVTTDGDLYSGFLSATTNTSDTAYNNIYLLLDLFIIISFIRMITCQ